MKIDSTYALAALMPPADFARAIWEKCSSVMDINIDETWMLHRILAPDGPLFRSVIAGDAERDGNLNKIWIYCEGVEVMIDCLDSIVKPAKHLMLADDHIRNYRSTPVISYNIFVSDLDYCRTWLPYLHNGYFSGNSEIPWIDLDDYNYCGKRYCTLYCAMKAERLPREKFLNT